MTEIMTDDEGEAGAGHLQDETATRTRILDQIAAAVLLIRITSVPRHLRGLQQMKMRHGEPKEACIPLATPTGLVSNCKTTLDLLAVDIEVAAVAEVVAEEGTEEWEVLTG